MTLLLPYLLLAAVAYAAIDANDAKADNSTCSALPLLSGILPGSLNSSVVGSLASHVGGHYESALTWLSTQHLFPFMASDGLTLQAYEMRPQSGRPERPIVLIYCAGWTETTIKYSPFLQGLVEANYTVYSFDFRGQGFSQDTGYDKGRFTHVHSFDEYVADLKLFAEFVRSSHPQKELVYVGNSLSGLVGLSTELLHPGTFSRLATAAPVIKPLATLNPAIRYVLLGLHSLGFGNCLLARLDADISGLKLTHNKGAFEGWQRLRAAAPEQLIVQGPSLSWLAELTEAGHRALQRAGEMRAPLLVFVASFDLFVDNASIFAFAHAYGSSVHVVKLHDGWHELYAEEEGPLGHVTAELSRFLVADR